jgi:OOP family OmpA-OmpF porin
MTIKQKTAASLIGITLLSTGTLVNAYDSEETGVYVGGSYGLAKAKGADEFDDDNDVLKLYIGGQFSPYFSAEAGYIDFGEYGGNIAKLEADGFTLAAKGSMPIGDLFSVYVTGGLLMWDASVDVPLVGSVSSDGDEIFYGVGGSFEVAPGLDIRLEYARFNVEFGTEEVGFIGTSNSIDQDIDYLSAGAQYRF